MHAYIHTPSFRHVQKTVKLSTHQSRFDHLKLFNEISIETKRTNSANKLVVWLSVHVEPAKGYHLFIYDDDIVPSHCMTSQLHQSESEKESALSWLNAYGHLCVSVFVCCCMHERVVRTLTMSYRRNYISSEVEEFSFYESFPFHTLNCSLADTVMHMQLVCYIHRMNSSMWKQ